MDLDFNEEQLLFRQTARNICDQFYGLEQVREQETTADGYPQAFWQALVDSGLTGLAIEEDYGGAGLGLLDAVVVFEEIGRTLSHSPLPGSSILAATAIALAGNEEQKQRWLPGIASGDIVMSCAHLEAGGGFDEAGVQLQLSGDKLSGNKTLVPFANSASHHLVLARKDGAIALAIIDASDKQVECVPQENIASSASFSVNYNNTVAVDIFAPGNTWDCWQQAMSFTAVALSAQAVGSAEHMLQMTAEYSKTREQFGKPIGQFQSLSHYMAELAVDIEASKILVYQAAWAYDSGRPWQLLAAQAKLHSGDTIRLTTAVGLQIHGGMGFTLEADPQLYYRRAKQMQLEHWDAEFLERRIADLLLDDQALVAGNL